MSPCGHAADHTQCLRMLLSCCLITPIPLSGLQAFLMSWAQESVGDFSLKWFLWTAYLGSDRHNSSNVLAWVKPYPRVARRTSTLTEVDLAAWVVPKSSLVLPDRYRRRPLRQSDGILCSLLRRRVDAIEPVPVLRFQLGSQSRLVPVALRIDSARNPLRRPSGVRVAPSAVLRRNDAGCLVAERLPVQHRSGPSDHSYGPKARRFLLESSWLRECCPVESSRARA
jgi:hypothetical protein